MFSCVGGFINLILHCRTTASADTATPPRLGLSFCVCSKALPDMQINTITGTNKDMWRERGEVRRGREGGERREGRKRAKPSLANFRCSPCLASPGFPGEPPHSAVSARPSHCLPLSPSLYSVPSDDSTPVVLLCPRSWQNLRKDRKFPGRGEMEFPSACALQRHVLEARRQGIRLE